jgi:glycosyltransferase involved in cell wall biosynthesis
MGPLLPGLWRVWSSLKEAIYNRKQPIKVQPRQRQLSVVLGSYNRCNLLQKTIESVRESCRDIDHEIIVVDGGSTDGALDWLLKQKDIITIVQHNRGKFDGRPIERRSWGYFMNLGFKITQGKYVLMVSDDCLLLPGSVARGIACFEEILKQGKRVGALAFYFRNWPHETDYYVQKTLGGKLMVNHGLYLRDALKSVGWVDETRYRFYKADGDLCLRMWAAGYQVVACPDAFVEHFFDENEPTRLNNNEALDLDRVAYTERWKWIYHYPGLPKDIRDSLGTPGRVYISYKDEKKTALKYWGTESTTNP